MYDLDTEPYFSDDLRAAVDLSAAMNDAQAAEDFEVEIIETVINELDNYEQELVSSADRKKFIRKFIENLAELHATLDKHLEEVSGDCRSVSYRESYD